MDYLLAIFILLHLLMWMIKFALISATVRKMQLHPQYDEWTAEVQALEKKHPIRTFLTGITGIPLIRPPPFPPFE